MHLSEEESFALSDDAPAWLASWTGIRIDSGDAVASGEAAIGWWQRHGQNPESKLLIFSDGLDVDEIERLHDHFHGRIRVGFGWGTLLTNDFRDLQGDRRLDPISLVCKVVSADGLPTVKLSDNPLKAVGDPAMIERYKRVFKVGVQQVQEVVV